MLEEEKIISRGSRVWRYARLLLFVVGVLLLCCGVGLIFSFPNILETEIRKRTQLKAGNIFYQKWLRPPYNVRSNVYVYSVENPDQVMNGSKPEVSSLGPFAYDLTLWNAVESHSRGIIRYKSFSRYNFNQAQSCVDCLLERTLWIPNIVYQKFVEAASNPSMSAAQATLATQTLFLEVSVDDMLFRGYKDPFLDKVCSIPFMNFICEAILDLPEKIAFFDNKNETHKGTFEAYTGELDNGASLGKLLTWNNNSNVPQHWWGDDIHASMINGSDGSLYAPYVSKTDPLYIFVPDLCRSIYFVFDSESTYKGIPTYRFVVPEKLFDMSLPENQPFCYHSGKSFFADNESCLPKGLIDISRCQRGEPPIIFSLPNFLYADESVKNSIVGLNESSLEHDGIILEIEPRTGTVLRIDRRSQVNIAMWKGNDITVGANLTNMRSSIVPLFSCFEVIEIDDGTLGLLKDQLIQVENIVSAISTSLLCLGGLLLTGLIAFWILRSEKFSYYLESRGGKKITKIAVQPIRKDKTYAVDDTQRRYF